MSATQSGEPAGTARRQRRPLRLVAGCVVITGTLGIAVWSGELWTAGSAVGASEAGNNEPAAASRHESRAAVVTDEETEADADPVLGPALFVPREVLAMLDQRKRNLDRREAALHGAEERIQILKHELEHIVDKYEKLAAAQQRKGDDAKKGEEERKARRDKEAADSRNQQQGQLAKIYESMPAEEAAARLERMPERKAIEVLRILKPKTAGAILASVRPERAARLTEQLLAAR